MKILVIGCGSIGQRHIRNLISMKAGRVLACDTDKQKLAEVGKISPEIKVSDDLKELWPEKPDAAFIALPTALHAQFALEAAKKSCHIFVEKPLSHNMDGIDELIDITREKKLVAFVGYNYRFNKCMKEIKRLLKKSPVGRIVSGRLHFGSYLPARHPWEDYRSGYGAKESLGGGIVLDAISHQLNIATFLFGRPMEISWDHGRKANLEIDVEDTAEVMLKFSDGKVISMYSDFLQRPYKNTLELIGEEGTIFCDFAKKKVRHYDVSKKKWIEFRDNSDPNDIYKEEIGYFIDCVVKNKRPALMDVAKGKEEMEILMKIRKTGSGSWEKV